MSNLSWSFVLRRLALVVVLFLLPAAVAAQTEDEERDLQQRLAVWDAEVKELGNKISNLERDIAAIKYNDKVDRYEERARLANGGLLPSFAEIMGRDRWFESFNSLDLPAAGSSKSFACGLQFGADYSVPWGSYRGDELVLLREISSEGPPFAIVTDRHLETMGGAWKFEPGGLLLRTVEMVDAQVTVDPITPSQWTDCWTVIRYRYFGSRGDLTFTARDLDPVCSFRVNGAASGGACGPGGQFFGGASYPPQCSRPTQYWSTHGQVALDLSNLNAPLLRFPDGTVEVLGQRQSGGSGSQLSPFYAHHQTFFRFENPAAMTIEESWTTAEVRDRNGNRTLFEYNPATRQASAVTDPLGRRTGFSRDGQGNITTITRPGNGGTTLTWTLTWQTLDWESPDKSFTEIDCWSNNNPISCPSQSSVTLARLTLPDNRAYRFTYEPWGALKTVELPEGGALAFGYGTGATASFVPPAWKYIDISGNSHFEDHCPRGTDALLKRRLVTTTSYPQGFGGPSFTTTKTHLNETQLAPAPQSGRCWKLQWLQQTYPDGKIRKVALCEENVSRLAALDGRVFADEVWDGSGLKEATYYGNTGAIGDTTTPVGTMYVAFERTDVAGLGRRGNHTLDTRPTRIVHLKDGVLWSETMAYDTGTVPAAGGLLRTWGNVVAASVFDGSGVRQQRTSTSFVTDPAYLALNLIRLPASARLEDGAGVRKTRADTAYDQLPLQASGAPNLLDPGAVRGNPTTVTRYTNASAGSGAVTLATRYYDTGAVYQVTDPRGARSTTARPAGDFAVCSAGHPTVTATTTNEIGQSVTTVADCFTDSPFSVTDANGQVTQHTYDRLGRVLKVIGPGDSAALPTQWFDYYLLGSGDNTGGAVVSSLAAQRTVVHAKDGTTDGLYSKTFTDGLGRTVQVRSETDPATSGGFAEIVATREYDGLGREFRNHVPCFAAASDLKSDCPSPKITTRAYDVLGRTVSVTPPGLPATTTAYSGDGLRWLTTVTAPNGANFRTRTTTDILGRNLQVERYWAECPGGACWLATRMEYDGAGRLLKAIDPAGNEVVHTWDDLGRRLTLKDPDLGGFANKSWSYVYDANGNLTSQTDPKGQAVTFQYDIINRLTLKDLPPAGPGEEDVTFFYDGQLPATCYSCDDRCATTTDSCNAATLTCNHSGTPCDGSPPACTYAIAPASASHGSGSVTANVTVTAGTGCAWTAVSNAAWISVTGGASGTGNGTVTYKLLSNSGSSRTGTVTIAGQTFTVNQAAGGSSCTYSLSPASASAASGGGAGSFSVVTTAGCAWTAVSNAAWITVTGGASGSGNGTVSYTVAANTGSARSGSLTAADQTFTVNQAALVPGNRSLSLTASLSRYAEVPSSPSLDVTGAFTVEAWVKTFDTALPLQGIAERYNWLSSDDGGFALRLISGRPQFWVIRNASVFASVESPTALTGGWHHVAGVFTGSELRIYVDGRLDGTTVSSTPPAAGTRSLKIGARGDAPVSCFDGYLDEVRLSTGALYSGNFAPAPHLTATAGQTRGLWKFDDLAATDSSGNGNHGSFQNGATVGSVDEYPEYGSVALDGAASYVQIPDSPTLDIAGKITVEAWIKTTAASANQRILVRGNYSLKLISASGGNKLKLSLTGAASTNHITSNGSVSAGVWHHVAGVFASGELRLYIDGVLDNSGTASEGPASSSGVLRIGAAPDGSEPFQGWIDEVRIAGKNLYTTATIPREPRLSAVNGTRGLWRFDRHFASDTSGNGNHGSFFLGAGVSTEVPAP